MPRGQRENENTGKRIPSLTKRRKIKDRLQELVDGFGSRNKFTKHLGLANSTVNAWFRDPPILPDGASIMLICDKTGRSADWLLFGEGPEMRKTSAPIKDLASALHEHVLAEIGVGKSPKTRLEVKRVLGEPEELLSEITRSYGERADRRLSELWAIRKEWLETHVQERLSSGATQEEALFLLGFGAGIREQEEVLSPDIVPALLARKEHKGPLPGNAAYVIDDGEGGFRHSFPGDSDYPVVADE